MVFNRVGLMLNTCISSCNGDLCLLVTLLVHFFDGLCRGCCGGSVAKREADLKRCFSISRCMGSVKVCASSVSVGEVL
jgi:hypothetical protein